MRVLFCAAEYNFLLCPYMVESRERKQDVMTLLRILIPFMKALPA